MNNPMGTKKPFASIVVLLVGLCLLVVLIRRHGAPGAIDFAPFDSSKMLNLLGGLFVVALMAERAVEVLVSVLRDADADVLNTAVKADQANLANAQAEIPALPAKIDLAQANLAAARSALSQYRMDTKQLAYCVSFAIGTVVSLVGVRGLHALLASAPTGGWFSLVDVVVTGTVIAGGSDGIHQMMTALLDFFNMLSAQSNNKKPANAP